MKKGPLMRRPLFIRHIEGETLSPSRVAAASDFLELVGHTQRNHVVVIQAQTVVVVQLVDFVIHKR